ncbi:phosphotransferase enzyme family protein [Pseudomonas sp. S9]|uniref:phosphotransferase enzyme family protein n=1 Tax=Pseudomonas sp. S9 TaxID=686578 RepID=UPI0002557638|nr:phosphotransferase [Pseudomonas sp. S9]
MSHFYALDNDQQVSCLHELANTALHQWEGSFSELTLVKYRENAVFSARRDDGQRVALRVHRHNYHTEAALRSELQWMEALAAGGLQGPEVIPTRDRQQLVSVYSESIGEPRHIDMLAWLAGKTLGTSEHGVNADDSTPDVFHAAGALAARIHTHGERWEQPDEFVRHAWDEEGLIGHQPFWGRFWELDALTTDQRQLLLAARRRARIDLRRYGRNLSNFGMIHADLVPENLLLDKAKLRLIDFDDAGFGWHMFELATALFFCLDDPRYDQMQASLLAGYQSVRALTRQDLAMLTPFLTLRGMTYLGWVHTRAGSPTALELTDFLIERTCKLAGRYLDSALPET